MAEKSPLPSWPLIWVVLLSLGGAYLALWLSQEALLGTRNHIADSKSEWLAIILAIAAVLACSVDLWFSRSERRRAPGFQLDPRLGLFSFGVVLGSMSLALAASLVFFTHQKWFGNPALAQLPAWLVGIAVGGLLLHRYDPELVPRIVLGDASAGTGRIGRVARWSVLAIGMSVVANEGLLWILQGGGVTAEQWTSPPAKINWASVESVASVVSTAALAPAFEELSFRGLLFGALRSRLSMVSSLMVSAAAYSLVHVASPGETILLFGLGLLWGYLTELAGAVAPAIFAHSLINIYPFF